MKPVRWSVALIVLVVLASIEAFCPNSCSGHGICEVQSVCRCFEGWDAAPDCSLRTCPQDRTWADKPYALDIVHQNSECSGVGTCDRETGLCVCNEGFTGNACQRMRCPNDCSSHGTCSSLGEVQRFRGPIYDPEKAFDPKMNKQMLYRNWDRNAVFICECDEGFFGSDCSKAMCPKGDDPLTFNQKLRTIRVHVETPDRRLNLYEGSLGIRFHGETVFFQLIDRGRPTLCDHYLSNKGRFGEVSCVQTIVKDFYYILTLSFRSWPAVSRDNNLFSHNGNPALSEFFCDTSLSVKKVGCRFEDVNSVDVPEYVMCSNRGICNFRTGICTCQEGFNGTACNLPPRLSLSNSRTQPGLRVSVPVHNFTSSALQVKTSKEANIDFKLVDFVAQDTTVAYIRGDGLFVAQSVQSLSSGETIASGGLHVLSGGMHITPASNVSASDTHTLSERPQLQAFSQSIVLPVAVFNDPFPSIVTERERTVVWVESDSHDWKNFDHLTGKNRGDVRFRARANGAVSIYGGGLQSTGGTTIFNGGLRLLQGGVTVNSGGVRLNRGGVLVNSGGVQILSEGVRVIQGGVSLPVGALTVNAGGLRVTEGLTLSSAGLRATGGVSVRTGGLRIPQGGVTINARGLQVTGGLSLFSHGVAVAQSGLTVVEGWLYVSAGGVKVHSGGARVVSGGARTNNGLFVNDGVAHFAGPLVSERGITIDGGAMHISSPMLVRGTGLQVSSGGAEISDGLLIEQGGATVRGGVKMSEGLQVTNHLTVYGDTALENAWSSFSDARLKKNVTQITGEEALQSVRQLRGVYFNWKSHNDTDTRNDTNTNTETAVNDTTPPHNMRFPSGRQIGLIAQELREVVPEVVHGGDTLTDTQNSSPTHSDFLSVDYTSLLPLTVEALREVLTRTETVSAVCDEEVQLYDERESTLRRLRSEFEEVRVRNAELRTQMTEMMLEIASLQQNRPQMQ